MPEGHTPGPWRCYRGKLRPRFSTKINEIQDVHGLAIVAWLGFDGINRPTREIAANAYLIAAAPDLLDACNEAIGEIELRRTSTSAAVLAILRAALAKAEGQEVADGSIA